MCGIFGLISNKDKNINLKNICNYANEIQMHRGPDLSGTFFDENIALSHTRLSILDIKKGSQPMIDSRSGLTIVFNGEIVNYISLKNDLSNNFKTFLTDNSDTEIILKLYELYGDKCVDYLKGMFSFAIWDTKKKKLFLARDHLGIKPLYFSETNYGFIFSSEIRTICKINKEIFKLKNEIEKNLLNEYLVFGNIYGEKTLIKDIYTLQPGHTLSIENRKKNTFQILVANKKYR